MNNVNFLISRLIIISISLALVSAAFDNFEDRKTDKEEFSKWITFLLEKCWGTISVTRSTVILTGNLSQEIITEIYHSSISAVALFTESFTILEQSYASALKNQKSFYGQNLFRYQSKAGFFIIAAKSQSLLRQAFDRLKSSIWWNNSGLFLLMKEDIEKPDCRSAFSYLWTAWQNGILSAVYFCKENPEGESLSTLFLYSYNPFSDRVPLKPGWKIVAIYSGRNGHPWTLFRLEIEGSGNLNEGDKGGLSDINSEEIFFDKIAGDLNGYPIRVNLVEKSPTLLFMPSEKYESPGPEKYSGNDGWLAQAVWNGLNATFIEIIYEKNSNLGWTDENGKHIGMKADYATDRADVGLNRRFFGLSFNLAMTYPFEVSSCCFLTKSKDFQPLWKSLIGGFDAYTISLTFAGILGFNFVLESLENRSSSLKIFLLFITCDGISRAPLKIPSRILFLVACGFFGMIATLVQGQVSALVTKPLHRRDIDTLDELFESGYETRSFYGFDTFITDPRVRARLVIDQNYTLRKCIEASLEDTSAIACIAECTEIWAKASRNSRFHIAKGKVFSRYLHYIGRIDWPIIGEFNIVVSRLFETGLMQFWNQKSAQISVKRQNYVKNSTSSNSEFQFINFDDLRVVFYLLFIGIFFASLLLIIEIVYFQLKKNKKFPINRSEQNLSITV